MQPIIIIAILAIATIGLSSGFLLQGTTFSLIAQDLGAKETNLKSPIDTARVDFVISRINGVNSAGPIFKNHITKCSFHSDDSIPRSGAIICKLTKNNNIVAEGRLNLFTTGYKASERTFIPINHFAYDNSNDVQNINDVKIIVLGNNPTCDFITGNTPAGNKLPTCT